MKHRPLPVPPEEPCRLQSVAPPPLPTLSLNSAMEIAQQEMIRRGLAETYQLSAFYAGVDRRAEGAAFAVIVRPHRPASPTTRRIIGGPPRLKLLIHDDEHTTLQLIPPRSRAA